MSAGFVPDLGAWEPWSPGQVAARLRTADVPWAIAGGWAIDLYLGRQTRPHKDIEIATGHEYVARVLASLDELDWFTVGGGRAWPVVDSPVGLRQHWGRDRVEQAWRLDVAEGDAADTRLARVADAGAVRETWRRAGLSPVSVTSSGHAVGSR